MDSAVDLFLPTVYCVVDDLYPAHSAGHKPVRRGVGPPLSDSAVLTVVILAPWQHDRSERALLRYVGAHRRGYFPRRLSQSAFNRRARPAGGALPGRAAGGGPGGHAAGAPAPVRGAGHRAGPAAALLWGAGHRRFADEAAVGRGGSDRAWSDGLSLLTVGRADGAPSGCVRGPARTQERGLAAALGRWRQDPTAPPPRGENLAPVLGATHKRGGMRRGPTGPRGPRSAVGGPSALPSLADGGVAGAPWQTHWPAAYGAAVLTKADDAAAPAAERAPAAQWLRRLRQVVATPTAVRTALRGLKFPRARTYGGLLTRLAAKIAAFNVLLYLTHRPDRPTFADATPLA